MGPLKGLKIIEFAGIGPGPFCGMVLADMGAEVIRIDRLNTKGSGNRLDVLNRGRKSLALELKKPEAVQIALKLIESADALIEGFRPGVMERLGLGPEECLKRNSRLVYGRITGWGQSGYLAESAGHDINYIAITGVLHGVGVSGGAPLPPLNLAGDFGGGGMLLALGITSALLEAQRSGKGQVVDAAMTDGSALLISLLYGLKAMGFWQNERGENLFDGGAHFYRTYQCADGKWVSIGSLEPQFYSLLLEKTGISDEDFQNQLIPSHWKPLAEKLSVIFKTKTREEWCRIMENTDVCFAPVLDMDEAPEYQHNKDRGTFLKLDGVVQPAPAPRFSRTMSEVQGPSPTNGEHTNQVLLQHGYSEKDIANLEREGII